MPQGHPAHAASPRAPKWRPARKLQAVKIPRWSGSIILVPRPGISWVFWCERRLVAGSGIMGSAGLPHLSIFVYVWRLLHDDRGTDIFQIIFTAGGAPFPIRDLRLHLLPLAMGMLLAPARHPVGPCRQGGPGITIRGLRHGGACRVVNRIFALPPSSATSASSRCPKAGSFWNDRIYAFFIVITISRSGSSARSQEHTGAARKG